MGYIIGVALFGILYVFEMRIMQYIETEPPRIPNDIEYDEHEKCKISVHGKIYRCLKTLHIWKTYIYDEDCNLLEKVITRIEYDFQEPVLEIPFSEKIMVSEENGKEYVCYLTNDWKRLISFNLIESESIVEYRKPWKNKRLQAKN